MFGEFAFLLMLTVFPTQPALGSKGSPSLLRLDLRRLSRLPVVLLLQLVISRSCWSSVLTEPQQDRKATHPC